MIRGTAAKYVFAACLSASVVDLVIVDLALPKLDGYQVIQQIKARPALERTRLMILSRRDGVLDKLKGRLAGAHAYLTKPFKTGELLAVVQAHREPLAGRRADKRATAVSHW